jgi:hypothetical protein
LWPTLVVRRAARACEAHLAQVGAVAVAVAVHAPSRHGHGLSVAVRARARARHGAVRLEAAVVLSQAAGWAVRVLRGTRGVGGRRRVQLVGKGSVVELRRWWGVVVGLLLFVGLCIRRRIACSRHHHMSRKERVDVFSSEGVGDVGGARGYAGESLGAHNLE